MKTFNVFFLFPIFYNILKKIFNDIKKLYGITHYLKTHRYLLKVCVILIPVVAFMQMSATLVLEKTISQGILSYNKQTLLIFSLSYLAITIITYLAKTSQTLITIFIIQRIIFEMRQHLIRHILNFKPAFFESETSGQLLTRATNDFDSISDSIHHGVLNTIIDLAAILGSLIAMYALNYKLALISTFMLPLTAIGINRISAMIRKQMHVNARNLAYLNSLNAENLYHNLLIKIYGIQKHNFLKFKKLNKKWRNSQLKVISMDAFLFSFIDGLSVITIGLTVYLCAKSSFISYGITPGILVAFMQVLQKLFNPLKQLGSTITMLQGVFTSLERIQDILFIKNNIKGTKSIDTIKNHDHISYSVSFKNVSFSYESNKVNDNTFIKTNESDKLIISCDHHSNTFHKPYTNYSAKKTGSKSSAKSPSLTCNNKSSTVIKDINFFIPAGKSYALVGATGSGKSTIARLLTKLYDGYKGQILIQDTDITNLEPLEYRKNVAMISQDLTLYSGSIKFNISLDRQDISPSDIIKMAKLTKAHDFIDKLPKKYDQEIFESGDNLSFGQKQLLSLTRALCLKPKVIILDEATSSLDPATESSINRVVWHELTSVTKLIIAHRLSTIKKCDKIIVLNAGKIIEFDSHDNLIKNKAHYYRLVNSLDSYS